MSKIVAAFDVNKKSNSILDENFNQLLLANLSLNGNKENSPTEKHKKYRFSSKLK
jgi:hypothetical protein